MKKIIKKVWDAYVESVKLYYKPLIDAKINLSL